MNLYNYRNIFLVNSMNPLADTIIVKYEFYCERAFAYGDSIAPFLW